jgi:pyruvate carboxylase subunit A
MRRALFEYIIAGVQSNIPFHRAIMENERFVNGDLGTQFIDELPDLIEDMKRVAGRKLPLKFVEKKKVAAAIAAAVTYGHQPF